MRPSSLCSTAVILATLAGVAACNKEPKADPNQVLPVGADALDIAAKPQILFQVFGDRAEPKMMPIAAVVNGAIKPIGLTRQGWRDLDSAYLAAGAKYSIYVDDEARGSVTVTRGMWAGQDEPLYPLPGCRNLRPLAAVNLDLGLKTNEPTIEFLASSAALKPHAPWPNSPLTQDQVAKLGRSLGHALGLRAEMDREELDSLDFIARLIVTGARKEPTLLVSFIDPQAGDLGPGKGHTSHLFALFDKADTGYVPTYRHVKSGDAKTVEFQRIIDHADVDGDGIDEIILEAWHYAGTNDLVVLSFKADQWHEVLRAPSRWCLDPPPKDAAKAP
jgi:hypothetical protein